MPNSEWRKTFKSKTVMTANRKEQPTTHTKKNKTKQSPERNGQTTSGQNKNCECERKPLVIPNNLCLCYGAFVLCGCCNVFCLLCERFVNIFRHHQCLIVHFTFNDIFYYNALDMQVMNWWTNTHTHTHAHDDEKKRPISIALSVRSFHSDFFTRQLKSALYQTKWPTTITKW